MVCSGRGRPHHLQRARWMVMIGGWYVTWPPSLPMAHPPPPGKHSCGQNILIHCLGHPLPASRPLRSQDGQGGAVLFSVALATSAAVQLVTLGPPWPSVANLSPWCMTGTISRSPTAPSCVIPATCSFGLVLYQMQGRGHLSDPAQHTNLQIPSSARMRWYAGIVLATSLTAS